MLPTIENSLCDFQELYRVHVHENLVLHGNIRDLEKQKLKRLKDFSSERQQFKNKYLKYLQRCRRQMSKGLPVRVNSSVSHEMNIPVSRDMVCKNCPYSFDTWNALVDVNRNEIDCYKSEILFGDSKDKKARESLGNDSGCSNNTETQEGPGLVTEIPEFRKNLARSPRQLNASSSTLVEMTTADRQLSSVKQQLSETKSARKTQEVSSKDCQRLSFGRSKTFSGIINANTSSPNVQNVRNDKETNVQNHGVYRLSRHLSLTNEPRLPPAAFERRRSHTIVTERPALLEKRRNSSNFPRSNFSPVVLQDKVIIDDFKGMAKLQSLKKLLSENYLEQPTPDDCHTNEQDIFDSVRHCRYLRTPPRSFRSSNVDLTDLED